MQPISSTRPPLWRTAASIARRTLPLLVLIALAAGGYAAYRLWRGGPAPLTYTTTAVQRGTVTQSVTSSGTLSPVVRSTVGSQVSGIITEILVDFNDHVKKGDVLARLDKQILAGQLAQAKARLASARAELAKANASAANAAITYERTAGLLESGAVSQSEVDAAKAAKLSADASIQTARSSIIEAQAALENAVTNLDYTTITAPIDGVIISRSVDAGQTVAASLQAPELFVIAGDLSKMELHASVAESDVGQLKDGMKVELAFDAYPEKTFKGTVRQVRNQATTTSNVVTYDAVVAVDNPDGELRPGMTATATFVVAEAVDQLVVPSKALRYRPANAKPPAGMPGMPGMPGAPGAPGNRGAPDRAASTGAPKTADTAAAKPDGPAPASTDSGGKPAATGDAPRRSRTAVWVLRDGAPVRVPVETGLSDGTNTVITGGGLALGDLVITADSSGKSATPPGGAMGAPGGQRGGSSRPPGPPSLF